MKKTKSFTMADPLRGGTHFGLLKRIAVTTAFTMAEILLSLAVIGIIAAMTLPTLTANFQDRAFNAKRQALHARLANAFRMMDYEDYSPITREQEVNGETVYPNIKKFMDDLSKSMSIKVISDPEMIFGPRNYDDINTWYGLSGNIGAWWYNDNYSAYFQTVNGESVGVRFNYPLSYYADDDSFDMNSPGVKVSFFLFYDLNGPKGPNKVGKDLGLMGAFYNEDKKELYAPMLGAITDNPINADCDWENDSSCQKYKYPDYRLATPEELMLLLPMHALLSDLGVTYDTLFCAIDGNKYSINSLMAFQYLNDDDSNCLYMLVTNDGSAPKNGYVVDISSDGSGE